MTDNATDGVHISEEIEFPINASPDDEWRDFPEPASVNETPVKKTQYKRRPVADRLQRAQMFNFSTNTSRTYRDIEVMQRIYSICDNMMIQDADSIYSLFLRRLKTRVKLERDAAKLEMLAAVLYYLDQRTANRSINIRDVLSRIKTQSRSIAIKHFAKLASKVCDELDITHLPSISNSNVIRNMMDELIIILSTGGKDDTTMPQECHEATDIIETLNRILAVDDIAEPNVEALTPDIPQSNSGDDGISPKSTVNDMECDMESPRADCRNASDERKSRYRIMSNWTEYHAFLANSLKENYDDICKYSLCLVKWANNCGYRAKSDFLDAHARSLFHCRKTFIAAVLYMVMTMVGIHPHQSLIIKLLGVVRSSFYRTCDMLFTLIGRYLKNKYQVLVNSKRLLMCFLRNILNGVDDAAIKVQEKNDAFDIRKSYPSSLGSDNYVLWKDSLAHSTQQTSDAIQETRYLHNYMGLCKPFDDRLWNGAQDMHNCRNTLRNVNAGEQIGENDSDLDVNLCTPTENHVNPGIVHSVPLSSPDTDSHLHSELVLQHKYLHNLLITLGEALGILKKQKKGAFDCQPMNDATVFKLLTYCLDALNDDTLAANDKFSLHWEPSGSRYAVIWKHKKQRKRKTFKYSYYGSQGGYILADTFSKAMFAASKDENYVDSNQPGGTKTSPENDSTYDPADDGI
ncbi:hypothetical protein X943_002458 [Babesia divergens]|uniref:Uncharacterized protein n=1 Tax=Babesia divergens TaxID=32595 RepID=A0AAD9GDD1_BABDI|nr:hypothetical protein X943_002458 [Babesia divergens]